MTKSTPAVLALVLACMFTISTALPTLPSQSSVTSETAPNAPRTLLGKPYRGRGDSKDHQSSRWTPVVADHVGARAISDINVSIDADSASAPQTDMTNGGSQRKMNVTPPVQPPFPLVLNTFPDPGKARSRWMKSKQPLRCGSCSDDAPPAQSIEGPTRRDGDGRVESPVKPEMREETESRKVLIPARRLDRVYDRGEWKSRLLESY